MLPCSVLSTISIADPYGLVDECVNGSVSRERWCERFVWLFPTKECLEVFNSAKSGLYMICSTLHIMSLTTADTAGGNGGTRELPASCTLLIDSCKISPNASFCDLNRWKRCCWSSLQNNNNDDDDDDDDEDRQMWQMIHTHTQMCTQTSVNVKMWHCYAIKGYTQTEMLWQTG